ncbi:hypothetical protein K523DRAFT_366533 [Schizophyllum commune Tattone D]|nr:hypothetical protein K525DRAFT_200854 [Schizophyllum commune Loenen D]KAI5823789.1 hypothetical protein K523DRAFT_366533 [Schizophyllum commune Tattone D]
MSRFLPSSTCDTYRSLLLRLASNGRLPFLLLLLYISFVHYAYTFYTRRSRIDMAKIPTQKHGHHHHHKPHGHGAPKPYRRGLSVADRSIVLGAASASPRTRKLTRVEQARIRFAHSRGLSKTYLAQRLATTNEVVLRILERKYDRHSSTALRGKKLDAEDRQLCGEDFVAEVERERKLQKLQREGRVPLTRNVVGDWRIPTSTPSTPSSSQQQASNASRRAGPGATQRAAAPKLSRYATPEIESSSEEENEGSAYEPSETEETAATTPDFEMASVDEDSKEDVRQVDEVLANTQAHPTITTAWLLERAGLSDRQDITAQMAYMGFTDKHAVLLAQQAEEQRKFAISSIFPPERFGEQFSFALAMFDQALMAAHDELRRGT